MFERLKRPILFGFLGGIILLGIYFLLLYLVSGPDFIEEQFFSYWYYIIPLALGFGIQVGIFIYLKDLMKTFHGGGKILGVTGTTSTAAMVSCCAHYLANLLPMLGAAGVVSVATQYQIELFWVGLLFNAGGIGYLIREVIKMKTS